MIVRIATEGQYRVGGAALGKLKNLDDKLMVAVENDDEREFSRLMNQLFAAVRREGKPLPPSEIVESDLVLPAPDTSLREARRLFELDGLIPG